MKVPMGFERYYNASHEWLKLLRTLYGLIQAAIAFWRKIVLTFLSIGFTRSKADPCLFFKWVPNGIVIWIVVVDDCNGTGPEEDLLESKRQFMQIFSCDDRGEIKEYIGCKSSTIVKKNFSRSFNQYCCKVSKTSSRSKCPMWLLHLECLAKCCVRVERTSRPINSSSIAVVWES